MDNARAMVTQLLVEWSGGRQEALRELLPAVEQELHRIARGYMRRERPNHTLQTTALVNEAYLRLIDQDDVSWQNRAHFFGIAARIMRQILIDHARRVQRKRGGPQRAVPLDEALVLAPEKSVALVALDDALSRLATLDPRKAKVVELRYFGGLSVEEAAEVLKVHPNTIIKDWRMAKAWLKLELDNRA
jgi:RNA polymerase sigma-70 factor (ECF subfamily)